MTIKWVVAFIVALQLFSAHLVFAEPAKMGMEMTKADKALSLITATPEEGFQLAVDLSRKGVTTTQPDKQVLFMLREVYSRDADALIACSQVIAIHFQTVAAANNYWKD